MSDLATTVTVIDACGRARVPVLLLSDPGMGKSSLVRGLAAAEGVVCETVLGSVREPADVAGMPVVTDQGAVIEPPAWAKRLAAAEAGYLFLDEASNGKCTSFLKEVTDEDEDEAAWRERTAGAGNAGSGLSGVYSDGAGLAGRGHAADLPVSAAVEVSQGQGGRDRASAP
ncbi:hypothetical protein WDZ17_16935 [Pseudokineococcus basanitobsidens]|uniref:Sigma-54 interacting transcriptional regulator n=1 Tax=Pseudokineococcus basanitobsidens TaxID=1926649 RepID=A0ABU8RPH6_9ACTN